MVWRLVFCLLGQLTLLLFLACYLGWSLNRVNQYAPIASAEEVHLESLSTLPAFLGMMDAERRAFQKSGDPADATLYAQTRQMVENNLTSLDMPMLIQSEQENQRRVLVRQWISQIGDVGMKHPSLKPADLDALNRQSRALFDRLGQVTEQVRTEVQAHLADLKNQEEQDARESINLMWTAVITVTVIIILIQLFVSNSIIGPIYSLAEVVRRLQNGDYTVRARIRSGDEIESLGETFNIMAENILHNQQELEEKNQRLSVQQDALRDANASLEKRVIEKTDQIQHTLAAAEEERAKLRTLIDRMPDGLLLFDEAGHIVLINDAALAILGHRTADSLQQWLIEQPGAFSFRHLNQQALAESDIPYRRVLRGETFSNVALYLRGRDNQTRLVSFSGAPVHNPQGGKVELSLLIFRDVTQELALRQELEDKNQKLNEAARLKDEFLATLSHELRTPLTPVISCAHLLSTDSNLDIEELKNVHVIERNALALSRMIDELLDLSAVMNRKLRLVRERTEMNEWTRTTLEIMRPAWEKKMMTVTFFPSPKPVELEIDPTRLTQVLTNLVNNAIKFTDPQGKITVRLTTSADEVRIAVNDNGAGLNRHEIDQIFEMFHQSRTRRTESVGGLGVGLNVARSLAELHGGGLLAESPGPGLGATFTLWLPRLKPSSVDFSSPNLTAPKVVVDRTLLRGRRILLVEDSADTRDALQRIFQRRECQVQAASSGEEALEIAQREPPEIIVSDIGLPGMSGLEFISKLRSQPEMHNVVAIALSGLGREQDTAAAVKAGFDAHLLKPVEIAILDQTMVEGLQKRLRRDDY